jgi:hypothetical protein
MNIQNLATLLESAEITCPSSGNQRVYADLLEESACAIAQDQFAEQYRKSRSVKSTEDFALVENGRTIYIDVKTRQLGTDLNMPNMISVDKLNKLLDDPHTELYYWMIDYEVRADGSAQVTHTEMRAVWDLPWSALAIQNLGLGQLQIANWSAMSQPGLPRADWHARLQSEMHKFYTKQAQKFLNLAAKTVAKK